MKSKARTNKNIKEKNSCKTVYIESKVRRAGEKITSKASGLHRFRESAEQLMEKEKAIWRELNYENTCAEAVEAWDRADTKKRFAIGGSVLTVALTIFFVTMALQPAGFLLKINGADIGYVESETVVAEAVEDLKKDLRTENGLADVTVDEGAMACVPVQEKRLGFLETEDIQTAILDGDLCQAGAWEILVDGTRVTATASKEIASRVIEGVKESYKTEGAEIIDCSYKETVEIRECVADVGEIMTEEEATSYILTGSATPKTYVVQQGDTLWDIAAKNGMKSAELIAANPDFNPDRLKIGQTLNLIAVEPYLTVTITEKAVRKEAIPYSVTYESSATLVRGQTKVKSPGKNGEKEVVSQVIKENGRTVETKVLSETVLSEPVAQVAYKGTKPITLTAGSGSLSNPLARMEVSDRFGASRGSRRHAGIDLRAPKGTAIYAADGGTVTKVSSSGSYGKLIVVDHGGGLVTKYAHCDSIGVSVGQHVAKGEKIGTVGRTGNATGNILHFEVLINGKAVNPLNYL